jgi:hypothetical protein
VQEHLRVRNPEGDTAARRQRADLADWHLPLREVRRSHDHPHRQGWRYRYYTCSIKARQGETGCSGRSIPMPQLDAIVCDHIENRLLQPERLEEILASILDRREEKARRREHIAELNKRAAETELRLKRLYEAIEAGVVDLNDPALKDRVIALRTLRDQAQADLERAQAQLENSGSMAGHRQLCAPSPVPPANASGWKEAAIGGSPARPPSASSRGEPCPHHGIEGSAAADACFGL